MFIVGMPRTGTTLIESILTAHSEVETIGESYFISQMASGEVRRNSILDDVYSDLMSQLSGKEIKLFNHHYLKQPTQSAHSAEQIVDKMPFNFVYLGLIKLLF